MHNQHLRGTDLRCVSCTRGREQGAGLVQDTLRTPAARCSPLPQTPQWGTRLGIAEPPNVESDDLKACHFKDERGLPGLMLPSIPRRVPAQLSSP